MELRKIFAAILSLLSITGMSAAENVDSLKNVIACQKAMIDSLNIAVRQADAAVTFTVNSLIKENSSFNIPLSELDTTSISEKASLAMLLQSHDSRLADIYRHYRSLLDCRNNLQKVIFYTNNTPYNDSLQSINKALTESIMNEPWLTPVQRNEIDSIAKRLSNYHGAVLRFDNIINAVDRAVGEFAQIDNSEAISIEEAKNVFDRKKSYIEFIGKYPYLYRLFTEYRDAMTSDPKKGVPEITEAVSLMLSSDQVPEDYPDSVTDNASPGN